MIFDNIENCDRYAANDKSLATAFSFLKTACVNGLANGRYEIEPDGKIYASVQSYNTKAHEDCSFEGHRKYIDVQYIVSGNEDMGVADISKSESKIPYDEGRDIEFFEECDMASILSLGAGDFAVFYPNDIHKPCMAHGATSAVKKIVVKIKI